MNVLNAVKVKTILLIFFLQFLLSDIGLSKDDSLYFFNSNLVFVPTESSIFEAKTGVTKFINDDYLILDIGVSMDLIGYKANQNTFSFGVDFFTFSNLRTENNFKFPVDAVDYFFGVNFNLKRKVSGKLDLSARLRISHVSSHLEDGHIYERTDTIFTPFVFSEEFINLAFKNDYKINSNLSFKGLFALNYIFHSIPDMSKLSGQLGLELRNYFTKILSLYISNNLVLASVNSESNLNENFETGFSLGTPGRRSVNFYFDYYDGQDYRGQYYSDYLNYKGLGIRFKF
ncbi:MAG: DUF1207 domain-containing protein [Bacteroidota bacterium]|nr:DUF1207 domain-containing protein [Bacteroidota bacterium]